ncbi:MAG: hypothetical protein AB1656_12765 [Candidatus Omnitrophota bacterium]
MNPSIRQVDFICPFQNGDVHCQEIMSPMRPAPSHREKKLFVLMGRDLKPTKNACPHCSVFIGAWRRRIGLFGHIRYFFIWIAKKQIRSPQPQNLL